MIKSLERVFSEFVIFLGAARLRALFLLIAGTGLVSLMLNAVQGETWVIPVQSALMLIAAFGSAAIIVTRMEREDRQRWIALLVPALGLIVLAVFFLPHLTLALVGAAIGWIVAGLIVFRGRAPIEYQKAIRHLRHNEYEEAVKIMDGMIKDEPNQPNHYRFRAELLRLWGKLDRARRDYQKMTEIDPTSAVAFNGLAEVNLQAGRLTDALAAAHKAAELAPGEWVALYNLGMIEDRLSQSQNAIEHLTQALAAGVRDARHRLLIRFYLVRAYARLGDTANAQAELITLRKDKSGVSEWTTILASDQAETLRAVIGADVEQATQLISGELDVMALGAAS
ncbi:MAG: tetratricopeptide repeat protein [Anaerolineae bacterium]|nr:tetratricopeptide repeat protein [Anaerolineae bacterium]